MKKIIKLIFITIILSVNSKVFSKILDYIYEIKPTTLCEISRNTSLNVRAMQGVYFYDHYAVYAGYQSDTSPTVVTLVDLNTCTVIDKNNEKVIGHANDITYNSKEDKFYIVTGLSDKQSHGFKIQDNKIIMDEDYTKMNFRLAAYAYDKVSDKYYGYGNGKLYTFPSLTSPSGELKTLGITPIYFDNFDDGKSKLVTQGIAYSNNNIYFARTIGETTSSFYNDSFVLVFDSTTGNYKYSMHFPGTYFNGHLEGITIVGNKIYFGLNVHKKPQKQSFLVYDGIDKIEKEYNSIVKKTELITNGNISLFEKENFEYNRIKIKKTFINDTTTIIDLNKNNCKIKNFDNTKIGTQTITVIYDNNEYKVDINIKKIKEISRGLIVTKPIVIKEGENFKYQNIYLVIKYNNNTQKKIKLDNKNSKIKNFDNTKIGSQIIKIVYGNKEYDCTITIKEKTQIKEEQKIIEETKKENESKNETNLDSKIEIMIPLSIIVLIILIIIKIKMKLN